MTPAKLAVEFRDGRVVEKRIDYPKGHPRNRMTEKELRRRPGTAPPLRQSPCRRIRRIASSPRSTGSNGSGTYPSSFGSSPEDDDEMRLEEKVAIVTGGGAGLAGRVSSCSLA